ncbi:hypothetical protein LSG31_08655 [Fodinisporobacter ferrooxydans]|uniref:DUF4367 domain-containing protein n=1 Tax=Fodinisporobacter ferrooxydans TaxID=2901836 RepID=A0ABY4CNZ3_9BACL|nr:hypothetical protein LSG31_08655 [Alicyclobacillaceae bacterium MYW30-H2]
MKQKHPDNIDQALAIVKEAANESVFKNWTVTDQMKDSLFQAIELQERNGTVKQNRRMSNIAKVSLLACAGIALLFVTPQFREVVQHLIQHSQSSSNSPNATSSRSTDRRKSDTAQSSVSATDSKHMGKEAQNPSTGNSQKLAVADETKPNLNLSIGMSRSRTPSMQQIPEQPLEKQPASSKRTQLQGNINATGTQVSVPDNAATAKEKPANLQAQSKAQKLDSPQSVQPHPSGIRSTGLVADTNSNARPNANQSILKQIQYLVKQDFLVKVLGQNGMVSLYKLPSAHTIYCTRIASNRIGVYVNDSEKLPMQLTADEWRSLVQSGSIHILPYEGIVTDTIPQQAVAIVPNDPVRQSIETLGTEHLLYGVQLPNGGVLFLTADSNSSSVVPSVITAWPQSGIHMADYVQYPDLIFQPAFSNIGWGQLQSEVHWVRMSDAAYRQWQQTRHK